MDFQAADSGSVAIAPGQGVEAPHHAAKKKDMMDVKPSMNGPQMMGIPAAAGSSKFDPPLDDAKKLRPMMAIWAL